MSSSQWTSGSTASFSQATERIAQAIDEADAVLVGEGAVAIDAMADALGRQPQGRPRARRPAGMRAHGVRRHATSSNCDSYSLA
jgi:hypothetical protein